MSLFLWAVVWLQRIVVIFIYCKSLGVTKQDHHILLSKSWDNQIKTSTVGFKWKTHCICVKPGCNGWHPKSSRGSDLSNSTHTELPKAAVYITMEGGPVVKEFGDCLFQGQRFAQGGFQSQSRSLILQE